jgi:hypothetical protein
MLAEGTPDAVRHHPQVVAAYLGEDVEDPTVQAVSAQLDALVET